MVHTRRQCKKYQIQEDSERDRDNGERRMSAIVGYKHDLMLVSLDIKGNRNTHEGRKMCTRLPYGLQIRFSWNVHVDREIAAGTRRTRRE